MKQVRSTSDRDLHRTPKTHTPFSTTTPKPHHRIKFSTTAINPTPNLRSEATKSPSKGI